MADVKLCKDCKHAYRENFASLRCGRTISDDVIEQKDGAYCSLERLDLWPFVYLSGTCGRGARFWEPK